MADVFTTLERVSALEKKGRVPGWLATHPDPGDRRTRIGREIAALGTAPGTLGGDRGDYLRRLEGMEFGGTAARDSSRGRRSTTRRALR